MAAGCTAAAGRASMRRREEQVVTPEKIVRLTQLSHGAG